MSSRGRQATQPQDFTAIVNFLRQFAAVAEPTVVRTFFVSGVGWPRDGTKAPCPTAFVAISETNATAHVIITEQTSIGERTSTIWLERESGGWRPRQIWLNITSAGGYDGDRLWLMAKEQRSRGNELNTALLYAAAEALMFRGPFIEPNTLIEFRRDQSTFERPPEIAGEPPHRWNLAGQEFAVTLLKYNITNNGVVYEIRQRLPQWQGVVHADQRNRALIDAFNAEHPEWREIADALAVRSEVPNGDVFGTVFDREDGYTTAPIVEEPAAAP